MRDLAELVRDGRPEDNYIMVHLLAAQVVAKAAYQGRRLKSLDEIRLAVREVAGYPMHIRISGPPTRANSDVDTEAAYRVASLIGLRVE
jgi:hypothetical protein